MSKRLAVLAFAAALCGSFTLLETGCAAPYSGKSEPLRRPKAKKRPDPPPDQDTAEASAELDDRCRTNFFAPPTKRRRPSDALSLSKRAENTLFDAEGREGRERVTLVAEALKTLENALSHDPYHPEATYKMAVAYALVGKKGCSIALLDRLRELEKMPEVERDATRIIRRATKDIAFDAFRKDADAAMGQ
jgi:hypothetical protein